MTILSDKTVTTITEYLKNQLQAHNGDLQEELSISEDGTAEIAFSIKVKHIANGKYSAKVRTRIPRAATIVETLIDDWQIRLPGM